MKVYGHRGAAGEAPENTIAGCRHAIERGTRYLELDLGLSKDNRLVVIHDKKLQRTTYSHGQVSAYTAAELAKMDARRSGPPWRGRKQIGIPTLEAVLEATPEAKGYFLEVKPASRKVTLQIAELLVELFPTARSARRIVITSMNPQLHVHLREVAPHLSLGLITLRPDAARELEEFDYQHLILPWGVCNPYVVRSARKQGAEVAVWTVNDPQMIKNLFRLKVDSIITDYPSMALPMVGSLMR